MKVVLRLGWLSLLAALRERETLFWFVLFPVLLLALMAGVFGRLGREGQMSFSVALVNLDEGTRGPAQFAAVVEEVFVTLSVPREAGKEPLFTLRRPREGDDPRAFLARAQEEVRLGNLALLVVIPAEFSERAAAAMGGGGPAAAVHLYLNEANAASGMASSVVDQVLARLNQELLTLAGLYRPEAALAVHTEWVGGLDQPVAYVDFLLPGIVLMAFFVGGLFSVPGTILFARDQKILRRYWVTPLGVPQYLAGFALGYGFLCLLQFAVLWALGRFAFGASVDFLRPAALPYLVLAAATFLALGFLVASLAKTAQAGMAIANLVNLPVMFLSGLFFPVADLPFFLQILLYLNPLSHLADGLRSALGSGQAVLPLSLSVAVPAGWIAVSTVVAAWRLRWDVGR
ncbi:ABC transporter permease [Candidatus Bipolaricaulota bacterium]|nr:ABC transporter permease [Candidatus Bipolaricaulota bacterium]